MIKQKVVGGFKIIGRAAFQTLANSRPRTATCGSASTMAARRRKLPMNHVLHQPKTMPTMRLTPSFRARENSEFIVDLRALGKSPQCRKARSNESKDAWPRAGTARATNLRETGKALRTRQRECGRRAPLSPLRAVPPDVNQPHKNAATTPTAIQPGSFPLRRQTNAHSQSAATIVRWAGVSSTVGQYPISARACFARSKSARRNQEVEIRKTSQPHIAIKRLR
jgi:hypothetical protein